MPSKITDFTLFYTVTYRPPNNNSISLVAIPKKHELVQQPGLIVSLPSLVIKNHINVQLSQNDVTCKTIRTCTLILHCSQTELNNSHMWHIKI